MYGVFTVEGNVVAAEPLTPRLSLLDLGGRQEQQIQLLARALAGYEAAARLLRQRFLFMGSASGPSVQCPAELLPFVLTGVPTEALQPLKLALSWAALRGEDQTKAASRKPVLGSLLAEAADLSPRDHDWARLPYPLAVSSRFPTVEPLPDFECRPLFKCTMEGHQGYVLVKFTPREYPVQVTGPGSSGPKVQGWIVQPWIVSPGPSTFYPGPYFLNPNPIRCTSRCPSRG